MGAGGGDAWAGVLLTPYDQIYCSFNYSANKDEKYRGGVYGPLYISSSLKPFPFFFLDCSVFELSINERYH